MHMISGKDFNDAAMDTLTKSCSPTIVITANGEVQTHEEATVYVKELDIFLTTKVLENTPTVFRSESFAMKTDILMCGSTVKNHISFKAGFEHNVIRRNSFRSVVPGLSSSSSSSSHSSTSMTPSRQERHHPASSSSSSTSPTTTVLSDRRPEWDRFPSSACVKWTCWTKRTVRPVYQANQKNPKTNKKETTIERGDPLCSEIPEWLQEFRGNFGGWWSSWTQRLSRQFFSWSIFRAHIQETWGFG